MTVDEVRPFGDRILVRPDPKLERSAGGLHIPETVLADNPNYYTMTGVVVALGDGVREDIYQCHNRQCRLEWRRTATERCPVCGATLGLVSVEGRHAFDVAIGDRVLFGRFAGKQIETQEWDVIRDDWARPRRHLIMRESEVLGIVDVGARVLPGYVPASWNKPSAGLTPIMGEQS